MKILIIGLGITGKALCEYLKTNKEVYTYDDYLDADYNYDKLKAELPLFDLAIKSPGIRKDTKEYRLIKKLSKEVVSEIDFAYTYLKTKNIIGVTGSNGKTTLARLLKYHLGLKYKTYIAGNVGIPLISLVNQIKKDDYLILELSSFQLEDSNKIHLKKAYITSLAPNHLDYYDSYNHYLSTKKRILLFCDDVISVNDNLFNIKQYQNDLIFDSNLIGIYNKKYHNLAYDLALSLGVDRQKLDNLRANLSLDKYRLQGPRIIRNFKIINDSKSTSSSASKYAYDTFYHDNIVLILGGKHKSDSFDKIRIKKGDKVYIYGIDKMLINSEIDGIVLETLDEVIKEISKIKEQYTILFSPGCDSHDQFKNYMHRGEMFDVLIDKYIGGINE